MGRREGKFGRSRGLTLLMLQAALQVKEEVWSTYALLGFCKAIFTSNAMKKLQNNVCSVSSGLGTTLAMWDSRFWGFSDDRGKASLLDKDSVVIVEYMYSSQPLKF
ncbi:hypothetical protein K449DRAFT_399152 [Hypoxylon sp. EC38]|nr:hypothetical protein K449DRAFT_399152 [Hypoxylon sp. EC38]